CSTHAKCAVVGEVWLHSLEVPSECLVTGGSQERGTQDHLESEIVACEPFGVKLPSPAFRELLIAAMQALTVSCDSTSCEHSTEHAVLVPGLHTTIVAWIEVVRRHDGAGYGLRRSVSNEGS